MAGNLAATSMGSGQSKTGLMAICGLDSGERTAQRRTGRNAPKRSALAGWKGGRRGGDSPRSRRGRSAREELVRAQWSVRGLIRTAIRAMR